jgi:hypothetical protein
MVSVIISPITEGSALHEFIEFRINIDTFFEGLLVELWGYCFG